MLFGYSIAFGMGTFVIATGTNRVIMTTDGITMTDILLPSGVNYPA
jgi:hypothetical protein